MSQVIFTRVPSQYEEACAEFRKEMKFSGKSNPRGFAEQDFIIHLDESAHEIRCEGRIPDSVFSALILVKDRFKGKLFYEGKEWSEKDGEVVEKVSRMEKAGIILAIVFFPFTLIYLLIRAVVWVPYSVWKATR